jgi:hypothetical protein
LTEVLRPYGYEWYQITDEVPYRRRDEIAGDPSYRYMDWLFAPTTPSDVFWSHVAAWRAALAECRPA